VRLLVATLLVAGCGFQHGALDDDQETGPDGGSGSIIPPPGVGRTCAFPAPELRLCYEFDDGVLTPTVRDGSNAQLDADASGLIATMRSTTPPDPAVTIDSGSSISVHENPDLDIGPAITLEAWIRPAAYHASTIIENTGQYKMTINDAGFIGCAMAGKETHSFTTASVPPGEWHHIACTFDGMHVSVYVDGTTHDCEKDTSPMLSKTGSSGTQIAPDFEGGIDGVRIYAKDLGPMDVLCHHAGQTSCQRSCNDFSDGGPLHH
jgi:hypothetical protein